MPDRSVSPPPSVLPPQRHTTGWLLQRAHRVARSALTARLAELDLTPPQFGVLLQLAEHQPLSQRQLVELVGSDRTAMVRLLDSLQARGLVQRLPSATDRRAHSVVLTPLGEVTHARAGEIAARVARDVFGALGPEERAQLDALLGKIVSRARAAADPTTEPIGGPTG